MSILRRRALIAEGGMPYWDTITEDWDYIIDQTGKYENPITSLGSAPYSNYFYTEVRINSSINLPTKGIKHEIGHCFGLNHYDNNNYSIMFPYLDGMAVSTVQQCDHDTINYLYN